MTKYHGVLGLVLLFSTCAVEKNLTNITSNSPCDYIVEEYNSINLNSPEFGTDSTLDIITWNLEQFPKLNDSTIFYLVKLINELNVEIIALQEIGNQTYFDYLLSQLPGWSGKKTSGSYGLGFIYKDSLSVNDINKIDELNELTRTPFMLEIGWKGESLYIINNHYKCCGDGIIGGSSDDEEYRRLSAVTATINYLNTYLENEMVVLLGDLNDELSDEKSNNVFWEMISEDQKFRFIDLYIACQDETQWSFPNWPSHLDHILITNELFNHVSFVQTVIIESFFSNNWNKYDKYISDHRPVGMRLVIDRE